MSENCFPCGSNPMTFDVQAFINNQCLDCQTSGCGSTMVSTCVFYTGSNLACSGINTNDTLSTALQKIDAQVCSLIGDYSTYQMNCLPTYYGSAITQESQFVNAITSQVCALVTEFNTFTGTTFPTYQSVTATNFANIVDPLITCASAGVTTADSLYTVLAKYCTKFGTIDTALDLSGVTWNTCLTVMSPPTTVSGGFQLLSNQICAVLAIANSAAVLPTFNNSSSCLSITGTADTLVNTVNALKTRVCQSPTFDINSLTWGCLTKPSSTTTDLQDAFQTVLTNLTTINQNILNTYSADFVVTNVDNSNLCLGKHIALATPIVNSDRLVASDTADSSPGTLIQKLTAGTNITLDHTTTAGQVIINSSFGLPFSNITSSSLHITEPGSPSGNLTIEVVPSGQAGNIFGLGTDGLPYVNGGALLYTEKTYVQMSTLISTSGITPGVLYKITDRGDRGIFVKGIAVNQIDPSALRLMLCPSYYGTGAFNGNTWIGIWNSTKTSSIGNLAVWGGTVWKNLTGAIGTATNTLTLDGTNWVAISKTSFVSNEYVQLPFNILYDIANDWIEKQWDGFGNIIGLGAYNATYVIPGSGSTFKNPTDVTDWNFNTSGGTLFFSENTAIGIFNNVTSSISANKCTKNYIYNNKAANILYNVVNGGIILNTITGTINQNICFQITNNTNTGSINHNELTLTSVIGSNSNVGNINDNLGGNIQSNSNTSNIINNICPNISSNTSPTAVIGNNIASQYITSNSNTGDIRNNIVLFIDSNSNIGAILANTNTYISNNSNQGYISQNKNNGFISFANSSVAVNIFSNINNGNIGGFSPVTYSVDVTDTIVNK